MFLYLAIIGYTLLGIVSLLDKFIVSNEKVEPLRYTFYSTAVALPVLLLLPFVPPLTTRDWIFAIGAGVATVLAFYSSYRAFSETEISHSGPLIGAATPFFTAAISHYALHEVLTGRQVVAIIVLIIGSLLIAREKHSRYPNWKHGMFWAITAGIFFAIGMVITKYLYTHAGFESAFVGIWGAMSIVGVLLLVSKKVRRSLRQKQSPAPVSVSTIFIFDKGIALAGTLLIQYAIAIGSVTVVNALTGLEYAVLVVLVALLSRFQPKRFKENYAPGELQQELIAVAFIGVGLALLL